MQNMQSIADPNLFRHTPLDLDQPSLNRLIVILPGEISQPVQCILRQVNLNQENYLALSYQWGSSESQESININGRSFLVTQNLYRFLIAARQRRETSSLWIDALCIDQTRIAERNALVKRMGDIYASARDVIIWLGTDFPSISGIALDGMFDLSQPATPVDLRERARLKLQVLRDDGNALSYWVQLLAYILNLPYWRRLWIVQEFLKAQDIVIWLNTNTIQGKHFSAWVKECANEGYLYPTREEQQRIKQSSAWNLCVARSGPRPLSEYAGIETRNPALDSVALEQPLEQVLMRYSLAQCSDWHDHIYGLLSLVEGGDRFLVDYASGKTD